MRGSLAACAVIAFIMPASAQTVCYGVNCPPTYEDGLGDLDLFLLNQQLGVMDQWVARTQWQALTGEPPESREQCFARCELELHANLQLCMDTHGGTPNELEDPWTTLGRDNCFTYARQEHLRCLAPAQIMNCPPA